LQGSESGGKIVAVAMRAKNKKNEKSITCFMEIYFRSNQRPA
jgi:hypothetical protein